MVGKVGLSFFSWGDQGDCGVFTSKIDSSIFSITICVVKLHNISSHFNGFLREFALEFAERAEEQEQRDK